ncbi:MAG: LamG domain-containing protein, partial [Phormidesmis sp.]
KGGSIFTDGVSSKGYNSGLSNDGKLIIRRSEFVGNKAKGGGGAIYAWEYTRKQGYKDDRAIIEDSKFVDNAVTLDKKGKASGGAIWAKMGLDIRNVTFADNVADKQGGALWTESKLPINIVNSTFSENRAVKDAGGAMFLNNRSTPVTITNSTIFKNTAGRANGALWFTKDHNLTLKNSIVAFNTARDRRQDQVGYQPKDGGGNLEFATSSKALKLFKNGLVADPLLNSLASVNGSLVHSLKSGSPAIDAGVNKGAPKTDQRGIQRDSRADIGAFELKTAGSKPVADVKSAAKPIVKSVSMAGPTFSSGKGEEAKNNKKLVAYLNLNEGKGSRAKDRSEAGRRNDGKLSGGVKWTKKGKEGGALDFDGKNDLVKIKDSKDINQGIHKERTISLWFNADKINTGSKKQVIYEEGGGDRGLNIYLNKGRLYTGAWNRDSKQSDWSGTWLNTKKISAKKWHHVDIVLDGGSTVSQNALRGYIDGQQFGSGAGSQLWSHTGDIGLGSINQGTRFHDGITVNSGSGFAGIIDEVMISNDALIGSDNKAFL